jgi:hypothetical protein
LPADVAPGRDRYDISVFLIKRSELRGALRRLQRRSVIELTRRDFRLLASNVEPPQARYLYLVRAGVQTPQNLSEDDFLDLAESASYGVADRGEPVGFKVASLMMAGYDAVPRNYAVLLASPERIPALTVHCLGGH